MPAPSPIPSAQWPAHAGVARRLIRSQHPDLAHLPVRRLGSGWDTVVHRLGRELTVRLPRRDLGAQAVANELAWWPALPELPLPTPRAVRAGEPDEGFPAPWSICRHVPGRPAGAGIPDGPRGERAAAQLAGFLAALHVPAPAGAPTGGLRGVPVVQRDEALRAKVAVVPAGRRRRVLAVWEAGLSAHPHVGPALWVHGDLHGLNVLVDRRGISGVVDFGDVCAGDPAGDLACAWLLLGPHTRATLREALQVGADEWARGRAWAAYLSVMFLAHSADDPRNAVIGTRGIDQLLAS